MATKNKQKPKKNVTKDNFSELIEEMAKIDETIGCLNCALEELNEKWAEAQSLTEKLSSTVGLD